MNGKFEEKSWLDGLLCGYNGVIWTTKLVACLGKGVLEMQNGVVQKSDAMIISP